MQHFQNKVAVVTGASSGLGAAVARQLVAEGATVLGIARNLERLQQVAASTATMPEKCTALWRTRVTCAM